MNKVVKEIMQDQRDENELVKQRKMIKDEKDLKDAVKNMLNFYEDRVTQTSSHLSYIKEQIKQQKKSKKYLVTQLANYEEKREEIIHASVDEIKEMVMDFNNTNLAPNEIHKIFTNWVSLNQN